MNCTCTLPPPGCLPQNNLTCGIATYAKPASAAQPLGTAPVASFANVRELASLSSPWYFGAVPAGAEPRGPCSKDRRGVVHPRGAARRWCIFAAPRSRADPRGPCIARGSHES